MYLDSSLARKATEAAMSSGFMNMCGSKFP